MLPKLKRLIIFSQLFIPLSGCEFFAPQVIPIEEQLKYQPVARDTAQILTRLLPLLWLKRPPRGPLYGALPLTLPGSFPQGFSTVTDLAVLPVPPQEVTCPETTCQLTWVIQSGSSSLTLTTTVDPRDGTWERARGELSESTYGWFLLEILPGGNFTLRLTDPAASPVTHWELFCTRMETCALSGALRSRLNLVGAISPSQTSFCWRSQEPLPFPWQRTPKDVCTTWHPLGVTFSEEFSPDSLSWQRTYLQEPPEVREPEFLGKRTLWQSKESGFLWQEEFPPSGSISRITHTFFTVPFSLEGTSTELRYPRLTSPATVQFQWKWSTPKTMRLTVRAEPYQGVFYLFADPLGVNFSGYLQTPFGDLITMRGIWFHFGLMQGEFSGYQHTDTTRPQEEGTSLILPDGAMWTRMLFRQKTGSFVELQLVTPPEGFSAKALAEGG